MYGETQKKLDEQTKINIKPKKSPFLQDRINNLVKVTAETDLSQQSHLNAFANSVENINHSILDDNLKTNAEFRHDAGLKVYITRLGGHKCCDWCAGLVGKFEITSAPADIWRRHQNCTCEILYESRKAGKYEKTKAKTVDHIRFIDTPDGVKKITTRLTPEQARQTEQRAMQKFNQRFSKPLTNGANGGIIEEIQIASNAHPRNLELENVIKKCIEQEKPVFADDLAMYFPKVKFEKDKYTIALHGTPTATYLYDVKIDEKILANIIKNREDYKGESVILFSCNTGNETGLNLEKGEICFAQKLANELGVNVTAPTKTFWFFSNGKISVGTTAFSNDGVMKTFEPQKE